jgi:hypothetical protein
MCKARGIDPFLWVPIIRGLATLREAREVYYLEDFLDMHNALKLKDEIEEASQPDENE